MHRHEQPGANLLDEMPQVVWMGVAAGMTLEKLAAGCFHRLGQRLEPRFPQVAGPVREDTGAALWETGSIEPWLHGLPK